MWVPFIALFAFAGLGLEVLEGDEIRSESSLYLGYLGTLFIGGSMAFIFNLVSFFPLTIFVNKFAKSQLYKIVLFTVSGGVIGVLALGAYDSLFMKDYQFSIMTSILLFSIAGFLYALIENAVKKNINFR